MEVGDPVGDRAPVREQAAEPAVGDVRHADARRLADDRVLRLLLRADEEDRAAALGDVPREVVRLLQQRLRLLEVDDVDAAALGEDEALHLRVPAARLVAEVHSGLQQLLHGDDCHGLVLSVVGIGAPAGADGTGLESAGTPVRRRRRVGGLERGMVAVGHSPARKRLATRRVPADANAASRSAGSGDSTSIRAPRERVLEREPVGVEELPLEAEVARDAVDGVAGDRQLDRLEVDADLVRPPGLEPHVEQRAVAERARAPRTT